MTTATKVLTEQVTFAGLRQQAERLEIPDFAKMRKTELIKAISDAQNSDATQRLKENPPDPLEDIRQEHESWLAELEGLAVQAIAGYGALMFGRSVPTALALGTLGSVGAAVKTRLKDL